MEIVTLRGGQKITVYPVPPFALTNVETANRDKAPEQRERLVRETAWLLALPEVTVPDDWCFPRALQHAGIEPRVGESGELLDYIEYGLLVTGDDVRAVQNAMYGALTEDEIGAAEAAFRRDGGGSNAAADPF
ncbi:MAG: hypothetical protein ACP5J4_11110 [Anaerolineae bacterium]